VRRWVPVRALAAAACGAFLLTGCFKFEADLTVQDDDTLDGTLTIAIDEELASFLPGGVGTLRQILMGTLSGAGLDAGNIDVAPFEDEGLVGETVSLQDVPLPQGDTGFVPGSFSILHEGDEYRLDGFFDLSPATLPTIPLPTGAPDVAESFEDAEVRLSVAFPGRVVSANGDIDGCSVSWEPPIGEQVTVEAVAEDDGSCRVGLRWWSWLLFGLAALVVAGGVVAIVRIIQAEKSDKNPPRPPQEPSPDPSGLASASGRATDLPPPTTTARATSLLPPPLATMRAPMLPPPVVRATALPLPPPAVRRWASVFPPPAPPIALRALPPPSI
jgi:hypothetical protein